MSNAKQRKNVESKRERGVEKYVVYTFEYGGEIWRVKLELIKGEYEQFYALIK